MSKAFEEVKDQAVQLPRGKRLELASLLLALDEPEPSPEVEAAWDEEIRARLRAVQEGTVKGIPYQEVLARVDRGLKA